MSECEHVWGFSIYFPHVVCHKCPKTMAVNETEAMLNEHAALNHRLGLCEMALRVAHLPLPPKEPE